MAILVDFNMFRLHHHQIPEFEEAAIVEELRDLCSSESKCYTVALGEAGFGLSFPMCL